MRAGQSLEAIQANKENLISQSDRNKTPRTGLKLAAGENASTNVSPAASPNSKKMRLMGSASKAVASSVIKATGLRDITNSAIKPRVVSIVENDTASVAPRLLESRKRSSSCQGSHPAAPPSKLYIMNTASELDFSSIPDELLPEIENVPHEPDCLAQESDEDFFEQYDFTYLTQLTTTSLPGEQEFKRGFEETEFESELSTLTLEAIEEEQTLRAKGSGISTIFPFFTN